MRVAIQERRQELLYPAFQVPYLTGYDDKRLSTSLFWRFGAHVLISKLMLF